MLTMAVNLYDNVAEHGFYIRDGSTRLSYLYAPHLPLILFIDGSAIIIDICHIDQPTFNCT